MKHLLRTTTTVVRHKQLPSLVSCVLMDIIGSSTYLVPFFGEFMDLAWAPISAFVYWRMFGFGKGFLGGMFSFAEELLPGMDFIPTFTITWFVQYFKRARLKSEISR